ncbi:hypothetical protein ACE1TF_05770 [Geomicrobium sp. JSM 1781026]|uniref:hypothetical protein n=1 Tax=Geomicrobium sp. JSM 1781026 TaxID=3344580 RepID=UPI0035C0620A
MRHQEENGKYAGSTIGIIILPIILSLTATAAPVWSWWLAAAFAITLALLLMYSIINIIMGWYKKTTLRLLHLIVMINVTAVISLIAVWRIYNENFWIGIVLLILAVIVASLSLKHRQYLNTAIRNPKQYPVIGKVYKITLFICAILAPASYGISVALRSYFTADTVLLVFGALLVPMTFLVMTLSLSAFAVIKPQKGKRFRKDDYQGKF